MYKYAMMVYIEFVSMELGGVESPYRKHVNNVLA